MARLGRSGRLFVLFGLLSLAAVVIGALVCASSGVSPSSWLRNLAAWGVGALAAGLIAWGFRPAWLPVALWAAPAGLAATLVSADQEGVRRWVDLGPVHVNVAMILLPAATVALAAAAPARRWAWIPAFLALGLLSCSPTPRRRSPWPCRWP